MMTGGKIKVEWGMPEGPAKTVSSFKEVKPEQLREDLMALPDLFLHTLDKRFMVKSGEYAVSMRAGNDNSELMLVLPSDIVSKPRDLDADTKAAYERVLGFLNSVGEVMASEFGKSGSTHTIKMNSTRLNFKLKTSRPKAGINLPKKLFGIPEEADLYLFAENHASVNFMSDEDKGALETCVAEFLSSDDKDLKDIGVFLKIFYEGGFAYNQKKMLQGGYLPINLSITCLGITPAFDGQLGIGTGYPYKLTAPFLPYVDTVPVTISAINEMSEHHKRYGLCFTRLVHVWQDEDFASSGALCFCSILPHGGFYYVPGTLEEHKSIGGLIYSFGESKEALLESGNAA